jgi:hypothetical protein
MSEDVARAVGAGSVNGFQIAGKNVKLKPLAIRDLAELQRDCLKRYRRSYLEAFSDNIDILGEDLLIRKAEESAKWDVDDLPKKIVYGTDAVPVTDELKQWMVDNIPGLEEGLEERPKLVILRILSGALDSEAITEEEVEKLTGKRPKKLKTGYVNWWITGSPDGMVSMLYLCAKDSGVTRKEVEAEFTSDQGKLMELTRELEHITTPEVGNG